MPGAGSVKVSRTPLAVDTRAKYLRAGRLLDDAALDKYTFTRDAFLQHRRNDVYDGYPPDEEGGK